MASFMRAPEQEKCKEMILCAKADSSTIIASVRTRMVENQTGVKEVICSSNTPLGY